MTAPVLCLAISGGVSFSTSVASRKTVVQLVCLKGEGPVSPSQWEKPHKIFGYFAF